MKDYNIYRVNSKSWKGFTYCKYIQGQLREILFADMEKATKQKFMELLPADISFHQDTILMHKDKLSISISPMKTTTAKDKLIFFCMAYREYRGHPYQPNEYEKANVKNVPVNKDLLDTFFSSPLQHYTIANYIKRINITRDHATNGAPSRQQHRFPAHYDAAFEKTLTGKDLQDYWSHLRDNGWEKVTLSNQQRMWKEVGRS